MDSQRLPIPKTYLESPLFEKNKKILSEDPKSLDDLLYGVTWTIATDPASFPIVDVDSGIQSAKAHKSGNIPACTIYFKEFEDQIILLDIEETKDEEIPF